MVGLVHISPGARAVPEINPKNTVTISSIDGVEVPYRFLDLKQAKYYIIIPTTANENLSVRS